MRSRLILTVGVKSLDYLRSLGSYRTAVYQLEAAVGSTLEK